MLQKFPLHLLILFFGRQQRRSSPRINYMYTAFDCKFHFSLYLSFFSFHFISFNTSSKSHVFSYSFLFQCYKLFLIINPSIPFLPFPSSFPSYPLFLSLSVSNSIQVTFPSCPFPLIYHYFLFNYS